MVEAPVAPAGMQGNAADGAAPPRYSIVIPIHNEAECLAAEVAELVAFLCSEHAGYIIGQTIVMDGGAST